MPEGLTGEDGGAYASLDGLSIDPVAMSTINDAVDHRTWLAEDGALCDAGWLL